MIARSLAFKIRFVVIMMWEVRVMISSQSSEPVPTGGIKNLLLTGAPRCGKTTVLERVVEQLGELRLAGFLTSRTQGAWSASWLRGGRAGW
jgi:hypothetical protein